MNAERITMPRDHIMRDIYMVARAHDLSIRDLVGRSHMRHIVRARHAAMWLVWWKYGWSLAKVGRLFGGRDHSTVWLGIGAHLIRCNAEHWTVSSRLKKLAAMRHRAKQRAAERGGWRMAA